MLPSPPPTDPDVQFSRIRFLTLELRSRRRKYKAVVTCWSGPCPMLHRPASSAIHCRSVDRCMRFCVLGPVARQWLSMPRRLPSLGRVPLGTVPRRHQYYEDATTPRTASPLAYWVRSQVPRRPPVFVLAAALPHSRRCRTGQDLCSAGGPIPAVVAWTIRDLPVPWRPILCLCPAPGPRSADAPGQSRSADAAPAARTAKAPAIRTISGLTTGLQHTLSTLQEPPRGNPGKTRFRLAGSQPLPCGSRTRWIASKGFRSLTWPSSFPGLALALPRCARDDGKVDRTARSTLTGQAPKKTAGGGAAGRGG